jgi:hypothetical protein
MLKRLINFIKSFGKGDGLIAPPDLSVKLSNRDYIRDCNWLYSETYCLGPKHGWLYHFDTNQKETNMKIGDIVTNDKGEKVRITGIQTEPVVTLNVGDTVYSKDGREFRVIFLPRTAQIAGPAKNAYTVIGVRDYTVYANTYFYCLDALWTYLRSCGYTKG